MQVRAKTFVAVGHETANRDKRAAGGKTEAPDADLLANVELGVHSPDARGALPQGGAVARAGRPGAAAGGGGPDSPGGGAHEEDLYYRGTSLPDDGIEMSSAPVRLSCCELGAIMYILLGLSRCRVGHFFVAWCATRVPLHRFSGKVKLS